MIFVSTRGHGRAIGFERSHAVEMVETVRIELTTLPPEGSAFPLRYVCVVAVGGLEPPRAVYETAALKPLGDTARLVPGEGVEPPMRCARLIYGQLLYH